MDLQNIKKLDNPVWHSLNESHKTFSITYHDLKCYHVDYCAFGGCEHTKNVSKSIDEYAKLTDNFFIVGDKPDFSSGIDLKKELICLQMLIDRRIDAAIHDEIIKLNETHHKELFELVNLVQPGYFKKKTMLLGDYYGIFKNGILVSVTGERMQMND